MNDYTRLFDVLPYQAANHPTDNALHYKIDGKWKAWSTKDCMDSVMRVSKALMAHGLKKDDKVAIISSNRPEWNFTDQGMLKLGIVNVPIYPTISESEYKFIFNDAEIKIAFVGDEELFRKIKNIEPEVPSLQLIVSFVPVDGCMSYEEFLAKGDGQSEADVNAISDAIDPHELATIIYTSGTTGVPKGVMLSHDNIISNIKSVRPLLPMEAGHLAISFLPLCHIFERVVTYVYMSVGVNVYYAESLETIGEDIKDVKPHFFSSVPRLLEKVYEKIINKGLELTGFKKALFFWAVDLGLNYKLGNRGWWYNFRHGIADKLIFSKWREALGGRVIGIVTGAAALQERLGRVFTAAGIPIREGYGQTESSPVISVNRFDETGARFGTIGMPIPGVEVKLGANDEILAKGPNVMMGYYKRPDLTKETIDEEGFLHTGDVGTWVDGKFLKITGRVKELFKTSGGKYVAPQVIENKMKESPYIEQICVIGENRKFVSALIVPSFLNLADWANKNFIHASGNEELVQHPDVIKLFQDEINGYNHNFGKVEQIKKFKLMPSEWTIDSGEMTPTMKVKRKVIAEKFGNVIEEIYD